MKVESKILLLETEIDEVDSVFHDKAHHVKHNVTPFKNQNFRATRKKGIIIDKKQFKTILVRHSMVHFALKSKIEMCKKNYLLIETKEYIKNIMLAELI